MTLEEAIRNAERVINQATQAAWEAGYNSGLETAAVAADEVAAVAKTPQGQGAARALATRIRAISSDITKGEKK